MKVYKFIFLVGFLNLTIPFLGIPFVYKNYTQLSLAVLSLGYALIVRAVEKERENNMFDNKFQSESSLKTTRVFQEKKIEDVVDMVEKKDSVIVSDVVVKKRIGRSRISKEKINI